MEEPKEDGRVNEEDEVMSNEAEGRMRTGKENRCVQGHVRRLPKTLASWKQSARDASSE